MKKYKQRLFFELTNQGLTAMRCHFCGGNLIIHLPAKIEGNPEIRCLQCGRCPNVHYESLVKRGQKGMITSPKISLKGDDFHRAHLKKRGTIDVIPRGKIRGGRFKDGRPTKCLNPSEGMNIDQVEKSFSG